MIDCLKNWDDLRILKVIELDTGFQRISAKSTVSMKHAQKAKNKNPKKQGS